jgi:RHS repeat-associated protein
VTINGTPRISGSDSVRLTDLYGTGMVGLLYSRSADGTGQHMRFLDFSGAVKPYLLSSMDSHRGATTTVTYASSTEEYLRDQKQPETRWRTTLPFPVHVVSRVEVFDAISGGRTVTQYRYHHGYWDGVEREFRGFAMVERFDGETFAGPGVVQFSPPTLTKSWFHPGPVAAIEARDWTELDLSNEYSTVDPSMLSRPAELVSFLAGLPRDARRAALRTLRGQLLRSELYALDGTGRASRPYTVTEAVHGIREESTADGTRERIFYPFPLGSRTTQWERGDEPMTSFEFPAGYDTYGLLTGKVAVAVPRDRNPMAAVTDPAEPYLATFITTEYARRDDAGHYLVDRIARTTSYEVVNDGRWTVPDLRDAILQSPSIVELSVIGHTRNFYDGPAFVGLPFGQLGEHGLPVRSESLAFTDAFLDSLYASGTGSPRPVYLAPGGPPAWRAEYPQEFRDLLPPLAGYVHYADRDVPGSPGGFYTTASRSRYDVHDPARTPRGLLIESLDPMGARSINGYDQHDLLTTQLTDAAGLTIGAVHDYRVLMPQQLTDVNGNTTSVLFSPLGLVTATFVRGRNGEGDRDLPSSSVSYDLLAFAERGTPASVRTVRRVHHDSETGASDEALISVQYSDGFARVVQTRVQAEDTLVGDPTFGGAVVPIDQLATVDTTVGRTRGTSDPDNVVVSGLQVYDNKGRVVRTYEPFFSTGYEYDAPGDAQLGQQASMFYDPRGQLIRKVNADGSEQRILLGVPADLTDPDIFVPTPWETYVYDANDNAGRTHAGTAHGYHDHWNTPASSEVDALGREVRSVARNGSDPANWFTTRSRYDIQGCLISVIDPLGREAFRYTVDVTRRCWRSDSVDAGRRDTVHDATGRPVETRDGKGAVILSAFDALRRPTRLWARDDAVSPVTLRERVDYGDGGDPGQPVPVRTAAMAANLLGRVAFQHDEAGLVVTAAVDFKGNILEDSRQVIADGPLLASYQKAPAEGWQITPFRVDWTLAPGESQDAHDRLLLEATKYTTTTTFDAVNRVASQITPAGVDGKRRTVRPIYNRAGALEAVSVDDTEYVHRIFYDAKGQRVLIAYGNGVMTRYAYDPSTFRLARLRTEPYIPGAEESYRPVGTVVQDYGYDYDRVGNVLTVRDRTPGSGIRGNPDALTITDPILRALIGDGDALDRRFRYDPTYRLSSATGREQGAPPASDPWIDTPRGSDPTLAQPYTETYTYDSAGSLLILGHASVGGADRTFTVEPDSNRLRRLTVGKTPHDYTVDDNGNVTGETTSRHFTWTHSDRLQTFAVQTAGAEPSIHAQYLYDSAGERVKKLVRRQGGVIEVHHYIDRRFEHHRWTTPSAGENNHLHVLDYQRRIAVIRTGLAHPDDHGPAVAMHLADHLGSSTVVLDATGAVTNREEYTPYGETSFGSYTRKRYRFTGKERDEESGLGYHSARYLHPALGRWLSCDPAGAAAGLNAYAYAANNPMVLVDPHGEEPQGASQPPEDNLPRDANGVIMANPEVIYVQGRKPEPKDELDRQIAAGNSEFKTRPQHEARLIHDLNENRTFTDAERAVWQTDPEGAQKRWDEFVNKTYEHDRVIAAGELDRGQRIIHGANLVGKGAAVVAIAGATALVAAEGAIAIKGSDLFLKLGVAASRSSPIVIGGTLAYGLAAPPGAPDLPGPFDDLGRVARPLLSTAKQYLSGKGAPITAEVLQHAQKVLEALQKAGAVSKNLLGVLRKGMSAKAVDAIVTDALQHTRSGGYLGPGGPSFDWLLRNWVK